jgi:hypothetical protein
MSTIDHLGDPKPYRCLPAWALLAAAWFTFAVPSTASAQQRFATPNEAASALASAIRTGKASAILTVLGRGGRDIASSGDDVADAEIRQRFLAAYDEQNQIEMDGDRKAVLVIGKQSFPFPIPIARLGTRWVFDVVAGRQEVLFRRIGRNELHAIQATLAYVDAQFEYAEKDRTGAGPGVYARRFVSRPGMKDGLYWPTSPGEERSPLGNLVAQATSEGYRLGGARAPFHGYFYRILTRQGPSARGGALNYIVGGKMIGGFALIAYPAIYRNSGVMTLVVNHDGAVFQKDLGRATVGIAARTYAFNPDKSWSKADVTAPIHTLLVR